MTRMMDDLSGTAAATTEVESLNVRNHCTEALTKSPTRRAEEDAEDSRWKWDVQEVTLSVGRGNCGVEVHIENLTGLEIPWLRSPPAADLAQNNEKQESSFGNHCAHPPARANARPPGHQRNGNVCRVDAPRIFYAARICAT